MVGSTSFRQFLRPLPSFFGSKHFLALYSVKFRHSSAYRQRWSRYCNTKQSVRKKFGRGWNNKIIMNYQNNYKYIVTKLSRNTQKNTLELFRIKDSRCFLEQETRPSLLSTSWFQERIQVWFHNQTKINWGPNEKLNYTSNNRPYQISSNPKTLKNKTALNEYMTNMTWYLMLQCYK